MTDEELTAIEQRVQALRDCVADGPDSVTPDVLDGTAMDLAALLAEVRRLRKVCADVEGALPANARLITDDTENVDLPESVKSLSWCWRHGEKSPAQCHICDNDE